MNKEDKECQSEGNNSPSVANSFQNTESSPVGKMFEKGVISMGNHIEERKETYYPIELRYDHFPNIEAMKQIAKVSIIEKEECLYCWLSEAVRNSAGGAVLYRGHSDASWLTTSTLYRCAKKHKSDYKKCLAAFVEKCKREIGSGDCQNEQARVAYSQHYFDISPWIDLTFDPYAALWFATPDNKAGYTDSELKDYFCIICIRKTLGFQNVEETEESCAENLKERCENTEDGEAVIEILNKITGESSITNYKEGNFPILIAKSNYREISNKRMDAQKGAFLYQCKHANYPFEAQVLGMQESAGYNKDICMEYVLISRKLYGIVRGILAGKGICEKTLFPDKYKCTDCKSCLMSGLA